MSNAPASVGREVLFDVVDQHVAIATLNRPDKRNAVNGALAEALDHIVAAVEADPQIRVAILASSNETAYCAGADLSEIAAGRAATLRTERGGFAGFVDARPAKPWIAAITGSALAGGCELALACDIIVASDTTEFGLPEARRGLIAAAGGVHRLPRALPRNIALEMIATGRPITAERAYALGLVNRLAPAGEVLDAALEIAADIATAAPISVLESLALARQANEKPDTDLRSLTYEAAARVLASEDAKEGPRAFLEKREPVWKGA